MPVGGGETSRIWLLIFEDERLEKMIRQVEKLEDVLYVKSMTASTRSSGASTSSSSKSAVSRCWPVPAALTPAVFVPFESASCLVIPSARCLPSLPLANPRPGHRLCGRWLSAGLAICEADIQIELDRHKPGTSATSPSGASRIRSRSSPACSKVSPPARRSRS